MGYSDKPKLAHVLLTPGDVKWVAVTPDSKYLLTSNDASPRGGEGHELRLWSTASGKLVAGPVKSTCISSAGAISPDGTRAVTGSYDGRWQLWELQDLKPGTSGELGEGRIHRVAFAQEGKQFAVLQADYRKKFRDPIKESRVTYHASTFLTNTCAPVGKSFVWPRTLSKGETADQPRIGEPADWTIEAGPAFGKDGC